MRYFCFILILSALASSMFAQVEASAQADSTRMLIGDQVRLHLAVTHPPGTVVSAPVLEALSDSAVEFLEQSPWDTLEQGASIRLQKVLTFTAWKEGEHRIPPIPLAWSKGDNQDTALTQEILLVVGMPEVDSTLADIKHIIKEPLHWTDYFWHYGYLVAMALVGWLVMAARMSKKYQPPPPPPPPALPAHEIALQKLAALKNQRLWQRGQVKAYYSELSYIVREYLEHRYDIPALEATTTEIIDTLNRISFNKKIIEKLFVLLQTADLVKFAKAQPDLGFHQEAMSIAEHYVFTTREVYTLEMASQSPPATFTPQQATKD